MKTKVYFLFIFLFISLSACQKNDEGDSEVSGIWIELVDHNDTIDFDSWNSDDVFNLRRGYEYVNGYKIPKFGSGAYRFKIQTDTILLNNMLWNCMCYNSYYFHMNSTADTFIIGNFFDTTRVEHHRMTFFRLNNN